MSRDPEFVYEISRISLHVQWGMPDLILEPPPYMYISLSLPPVPYGFNVPLDTFCILCDSKLTHAHLAYA